LSFPAVPPYITDASQDLQYTGNFTFPAAIPAGARTVVLDVTMNVDSSTGVHTSIEIDCLNNGQLGVDIHFDYFDPFGNLIFAEVLAQAMTSTGGGNTITISTSKFVNIPQYNLGPLGAIRTRVYVTPTIAQGAAVYSTTLVFKTPMGARSGVNGPVVLAPYTGVTGGSALTVSGWANFNLIPNPALRQNLQLHYGKYDPGEVQWCKIVLSERQKFEIRSVWNLRDYMNSRDLLAEMADVSVHARAAALSFGDVIGAVKKYFLPVAKDALKTYLNAGTPSLPFIGAAASGRTVARAASGDIVVPRPLGIPGGTLSVAYDPRARAMAMDRHRPSRRVVVPRHDRVVAFPVIVTHPNVAGGLYEQLYAASNIDIFHFGTDARVRAGQFLVQGSDTLPHGNVSSNIYLFPIEPAVFPKEVKLVPGPIVSGHSCDAAIQVVCHGRFHGVLPYAITGDVDGEDILDNAYFARKLEYCRRNKIPLAGNDATADLEIDSWVDVPHAFTGQVYTAV